MNRLTPIALLLAAVLPLAPALADDDDHRGRGERNGGGKYERSGGKSERNGGRMMTVPQDAKYKAECGTSCHMSYHPGFLPAASWRRLMGGLDKHFGQDASLDAATSREITDFLVRHSVDNAPHRWSDRILRGQWWNGDAPIAISKTWWFERKHREVSPAVWNRPAVGSPARCEACHPDAERGDYNEHGVRIPR